MTSPAFTALLLRRSARGYTTAALAALDERAKELRASLPATFASAEDDFRLRILQLSESVGVDAPALFADAVSWYRVAFAHRSVPDGYLKAALEALRSVLVEDLPATSRAVVERHLSAGLAVAESPPRIPDSPIEQDGPHSDPARRFLLATLEGRPDDALDVLRDRIAAGVPVDELQDHVFVPVQREVGRMWLLGEAPIADEHLTSRTVERAIALLQEKVPRPGKGAPHVLAFATSGNAHDLGIRLVAQRLQMAGYRVTNLGADMPVSDLAWALADRDVDLLAVSVTMLLQLSSAAAVVTLRNQELGGKPPILVGGPPFAVVPDLYARIGADAAATDGAAAAAAAKRLIGR